MLKIQGTTIGSKKKKKKTIKELVIINTRPWKSVAWEFSTWLHVSHFQSFICLWVVILWKRSTAFEDEITKPDAAKATFRISFLYTSFMCRAAHHEPPQASVVRRNFSYLISHLWGEAACSDYMPSCLAKIILLHPLPLWAIGSLLSPFLIFIVRSLQWHSSFL